MTGRRRAVGDFESLVQRAVALASSSATGRAVLGVVGAPGAGKSTLAVHLRDAVERAGLPAVRVPMDGFHLADVELDRLGRRDRKGAIDTFDAAGYGALLARIVACGEDVVYGPSFDREIEQPIAGAIPVLPEHRVVITEGNYLLSPEPAWRATRALLDEVWFCDIADEVRRERLVERHERFGKSARAAHDWVNQVDEANARAIIAVREEADLVVDLLGLDLDPADD